MFLPYKGIFSETKFTEIVYSSYSTFCRESEGAGGPIWVGMSLVPVFSQMAFYNKGFEMILWQ